MANGFDEVLRYEPAVLQCIYRKNKLNLYLWWYLRYVESSLARLSLCHDFRYRSLSLLGMNPSFCFSIQYHIHHSVHRHLKAELFSMMTPLFYTEIKAAVDGWIASTAMTESKNMPVIMRMSCSITLGMQLEFTGSHSCLPHARGPDETLLI